VPFIKRMVRVLLLGLLTSLAFADATSAQGSDSDKDRSNAVAPPPAAWSVGTPVPLPVQGVPQQLWASAAPDDPDRLVVCTFESDGEHGEFISSIYVSLDAGNTWMRTLLDDHSDWVSETNCAAGSQGRAYFVAGVSDTSRGTMVHELGSTEAYRSWDGGVSWSRAREYPFIDWTAIGVNPEGLEERVFLFGNVQANGIGDHGAGSWNAKTKPLLVSSDRLSFSEPIYPDEVSYTQNGYPLSVVAPSSDVVLALYAEIPNNVFSIYRWNGKRYQRLSTIAMPVGVKPYGPLSAHMAMDKMGKFRGRLYAAIPGIESHHPVVVLAHSDDEGRSWTAQVILRRAKELSEHEIEYFSAGITVNRDGVVGLEWLPGTDCAELAISTDGGISVAERHALGNCPDSLDKGSVSSPTASFLKVYNDRSAVDHPLQYASGALPGFTIQVATSLLASVQIDADAGGRFHVFWCEMGANGPMTLTATVLPQRTWEAYSTLSDSIEVTKDSLIRVERELFDERTGTFRIDLQIKNQSPLPIAYPTILEVVSSRSDCGKVRYLNAVGYSGGGDTLFRVPRRPDRLRLFPGEASLPVHLEIQADGCGGSDARLVDRAKQQALESRPVFPLVLRFQVFAAVTGPSENVPRDISTHH